MEAGMGGAAMTCAPSLHGVERTPHRALAAEAASEPDDRGSAILYLRVASRCGDPLEREVLRRRAAELVMPRPVRPRDGTPA
jgi:hypothetical protein